MKILKDNKDRTILINSETKFGTDLGWEENFQEFEQETLKSIINPVENFETVRYVHSGYTSDLGVIQNDIWYEFYFSNFSGGTDGGLNYEYVGLTPEANANLLKSENTSFFRLEFYKAPDGENPNSKNTKLVFTKNLPIPMGQKINYTPINEEIFVPVFTGSNDRNKENMNLYWFQDDTVLAGTNLTGNTFYLSIKFYNTLDGTSIPMLNKQKNILLPIDEEQDMYRRVEFNRDEYTYIIYSGITTDHRIGESTSNTPITCYAGSYSSSSPYEFVAPPRVAYGIDTSGEPTYADSCYDVIDSTAYLESPYQVPTVGTVVYLTLTGDNPYIGDSVNYHRMTYNSSSYTVRMDSNGMTLEAFDCNNLPSRTPSPTPTPTITPTVTPTRTITPTTTPSISL